MRLFRKTSMLAAGLLFALPLSCFAIKSNDFTKASNSHSRKYQTEKSRYGQERSKMQDKRADSKMFSPKTDTSEFQGEKFGAGDSQAARAQFDKISPDASKKFDGKMFEGTRENLSIGGKRAQMTNSELNLSKKYEGKIDIYKRDVDKQREIDAYYSSLTSRSMDEINKFYSRASRDPSAADKVKQAGSQLNGGSDDFFDFLSSKEKIERSPVSFSGREVSRDEFFGRRAAEAEISKRGGSTQTAELPQNSARNLPAQTSPQTPVVRRQTTNGEYTQTRAVSPSSQVRTPPRKDVAEETIDPNRAKKLHFLNVPENMRSKATIKVQVKEE